jgi:hypothetical protein
VKFDGFIGGAYLLESVNVDAQRCVNLYPEVIESGKGKEGQVAYLRSTPGLEKILEIGSGPIRMVHADSIGRIFVASGGKLFLVTPRAEWTVTIRPVDYDAKSEAQSIAINTTTDVVTITSHGFYAGLRVRLVSSGTIPGGLSSGVDFYVIALTSDTFSLATSLANALSSTAVDITSVGTGTLTVTPQISTANVRSSYATSVRVVDNLLYFPRHGFVTGDQVRFSTTGIFPGSFSKDTIYYLIRASADEIRLASSPTNAQSGTFLSFTAVNSAILYSSIEISSNGVEFGDEDGLASSSGLVKAASMSALGDGSDSSTIFVDGVSNYLYMDDPGINKEFFGNLSSQEYAEVTATESGFTSIVFTCIPDAPSFLGKNLYLSYFIDPSVGSGDINIAVSRSFGFINPTLNDHIYIDIECRDESLVMMSTAELVEFINTNEVSGRPEIRRVEPSRTSIAPSLTPVNFYSFDDLKASGGDASEDAFGSSGFVEETTGEFTSSFAWSLSLAAAFGYNSVDNATHIAWIDGYFIVNQGGTNKFYVSDLKGFNIDTLSFTSAEGSPDIIIALISNNRDLWVFGERSVEVYTNTGNADFPFERIPGGFLEVGCAAGYSVAKIDGTILWLGRSNEGQGQVFAAKGMTPQRVSTHAIEQAISSYTNPSSATAYTYEAKGHKFYVLNFDEATWVYDLTTGLWHERAYTSEGNLVRHRAGTCAYSPGGNSHLVGDYENNKLYIMRDGYYLDDEDAITRLRSTPHVSSGLDRLFCPKFQVDMEVGVGLDGGGQGSDPQVMLDWSDDGGNTWSSEIWAAIGRVIGGIGEFKTRVIWRRLGSFRDRIFRLKVTDPVKVTLLSAEIDVEKGSS